jgi:hypothetical protein
LQGAGVRKALLLAALALSLGTAALAQAELAAEGDLFVKFKGGLEPSALPRKKAMPIAVSVAGTVRTLSGESPPALRWIRIELARGGKLDTWGLPVCRRWKIASSSDEQALRQCGDALVGGGRYSSNSSFPEQAVFPADGRILAFNSIVHGQKAILAHIYGTDPIPITRVIVLTLHHAKGLYGTVLTGELPIAINRNGYVTRIAMRLFREYEYKGRERSYLSAACPAPAGFPGASFPFAKATMGFEDGRTLSGSLTRSCRVRR